MSREIPEPVRAAAGLAATVLDEARRFPGSLPGLPLRAIGLAMQATMKLQQHYAGLVARGDELFTGLRGDDEPGLATFDDDVTDAVVEKSSRPAAVPPGFRDSAFDRAAPAAPVEDEPVEVLAVEDLSAGDVAVEDLPVEDLPVDPEADAVVDAVIDEAATVVEKADGAQAALEEVALDALVDEALVDQAPPADGAPGMESTDVTTAAEPAGATQTTETADAAETAQPDGAAEAAGAEILETYAEVTDGLAADADVAPAAPTEQPTTQEPEGGSELSGSQAAGAAPVDGYDGFTVAQLRGRLRGYTLGTVADLLAYEEATRARDPFLRMLRNRLEKLEAQAVESSPLAPRGA